MRVDAEFMKKLSDLVEKYNEYLDKNNGKDQLDIHKELKEIFGKIEMYLEK